VSSLTAKQFLFVVAALLLITFSSIGAVLAKALIVDRPGETLGQIATFGLNNGDGTCTVKANIIDAMKFTCSSAGNLTQIALLIGSSCDTGADRVYWPGRHVKVAIYDDNLKTDMPNKLLWGSYSAIVASGWMEWQTPPISLSADSSYWLAFWLDADTAIRYQTGAGRQVLWYESYGSWPSYVSVISSGKNTEGYVMLATYLVGSPQTISTQTPEVTVAITTSPSPTPIPSQTPQSVATTNSITVGVGEGKNVLPITTTLPMSTPRATSALITPDTCKATPESRPRTCRYTDSYCNTNANTYTFLT
jgi:hypothetical protein